MTDPSRTDPGTTDGDEHRADLSDAFGRPATASLRGLLPPRPRRSTEQGPTVALQVARDASQASDAAVVTLAPRTAAPCGTPGTAPADAVPAETGPAETGPAETGPVDDTPASRPVRRRKAASETDAGTANRRWGSVRMASREHVELLLLVALRRGPADVRELAERLRTDSGGGLAPPPTTVARTLHHFARHGLVEVGTGTERRRYRLTELGMRITRARVRAWRSLRGAVDAVLGASERA